MLFLKQSNNASAIIGPFVDDADGKTAETGLTITQADLRISKNGGAFAQTSTAAGNVATHVENGYYEYTVSDTDSNTLGRLIVAISESGALPVWREFMVLPAMIYDSFVAGTDRLDTNVTHIADTAQTANDNGADINDILVDTGTTIPNDIAALQDLSAAQVNAEVVDALNVDTYAEPGQANPPATTTLVQKISYLYKMWRNKTMTDATTIELYNDAGAVVDQKSTISDDGTDFTKGEYGTGP